jgi:hypothetical protein
MNLTISARRSKTLVFTLLFVTGMVFGQDAPMVSPPLTMKAGTILTVRINELLSSDHNRVGDVFFATLTQPIVVLGIVVTRHGQTATGRVVEAKKAGRVSGVSRLGITLTNLTLVDGQSVPIQAQLLAHQGSMSGGRDSAVVEPETLMTFQVTAPVTIKTNDAPQAFRFVDSADYPPAQTQPEPALTYSAPPAYPSPYYVFAPPYYLYYPYYYPFYGYPYFYGPSFGFFFGYPGYHYHGYPGHYGHVYAPRPVPYRGGMIAYTSPGGMHH